MVDVHCILASFCGLACVRGRYQIMTVSRAFDDDDEDIDVDFE
jgi:hypothetical protein